MLAYCIDRKILSLQEVPRSYLVRQQQALQVTLQLLRETNHMPLARRWQPGDLVAHYEWLMREIQKELEARKQAAQCRPRIAPVVPAPGAPDCWL